MLQVSAYSVVDVLHTSNKSSASNIEGLLFPSNYQQYALITQEWVLQSPGFQTYFRTLAGWLAESHMHPPTPGTHEIDHFLSEVSVRVAPIRVGSTGPWWCCYLVEA